MNRIDNSSALVIPSDLELYSTLPTDATYLSIEEVPYQPTSTVTNESNINFEIPGSSEEFIKLSHTYFTFGCRILHNGQPLIAQNSYGPVNNFAHSIFRSVTVHLGNQIVSSGDDYPYRAYKTILLGYGNEAKMSHLQCGMFEQDTAGHFDSTTVLDHEDSPNKGLVKRARAFAEGRYVYFKIPLICDIFGSSKLLPNLVDMRVTLTRSAPAFCLMADRQRWDQIVANPGAVPAVAGVAARDDPPNGLIEIVNPQLWITKVKLLPSMLIGQIRGLEVKPAKFNITRVLTKTFTVTQGSHSMSLDNVFSGRLPKRIVYGFVTEASNAGSYAASPFNFEHVNLTQTAVYCNGRSFPLQPFTPTYNNPQQQNWVRPYYSLFDAMGIHHGNRGLGISLQDFPNGNCLYAIDLTPNKSAGNMNHVNIIKEGQVRITAQFGVGLRATMVCYIYGEFDNLIQIDKDRRVFLDYSA